MNSRATHWLRLCRTLNTRREACNAPCTRSVRRPHACESRWSPSPSSDPTPPDASLPQHKEFPHIPFVPLTIPFFCECFAGRAVLSSTLPLLISRCNKAARAGRSIPVFAICLLKLLENHTLHRAAVAGNCVHDRNGLTRKAFLIPKTWTIPPFPPQHRHCSPSCPSKTCSKRKSTTECMRTGFRAVHRQRLRTLRWTRSGGLSRTPSSKRVATTTRRTNLHASRLSLPIRLSRKQLHLLVHESTFKSTTRPQSGAAESSCPCPSSSCLQRSCSSRARFCLRTRSLVFTTMHLLDSSLGPAKEATPRPWLATVMRSRLQSILHRTSSCQQVLKPQPMSLR